MLLQILIRKDNNEVEGWVTGGIAVSNKDCDVKAIAITEEEAAKCTDGRSELLWDGQKISFRPKAEYAQKETERRVLKDKFESGAATQADIIEAIKKLL